MIQLRMRGLPPTLAVSALIAAWPLVFVLYVRYAQHQAIEGSLFALAIGAALLPWTSRLAGRLTYRAAVDDFALHVAGEALPWEKITRVTRQRTWRRRSIVLERGRTSKVVLVTHDLFAGRLEPLDELLRRLPEAVRPS
jgi:hypothetical protein